LGFPILLVVNVLFIVFWLIVYRWYAFISLLGLLVAYSPLHTYLPLNLGDEEESTITLKILSYNCEAFAKGAPHTADNPNPVLDYLAHSGADIICLQEAPYRRLPQPEEGARGPERLSLLPFTSRLNHHGPTGQSALPPCPLVSAPARALREPHQRIDGLPREGRLGTPSPSSTTIWNRTN